MVITSKQFLEAVLEIQENPGNETELGRQLKEVAKRTEGCIGLFYISEEYKTGARIYWGLRDRLYGTIANDVPRIPRA